MRNKLLILGGGYLQVPGIVKARQMGYYVIVADQNPNAVGFKFADQSAFVSTTDTKGISELAKENKIDGIMTLASDRPVQVVAQVSKEMGFPFMSPEDAVAATNKDAMRLRLRESGIPIPQFRVIHDLTEFRTSILDFGEEFIVKPTDNSGGRGINLVKGLKDAEKAYRYSCQCSVAGTVLIEEYMKGQEVSVEAITHGGKTDIIAITDKLTTGEPYFVEVGHTIQSSLSSNVKEKIKDITIKTINAVGIVNGPSHTEIKITEDGPKVVEIGARLGGGNITSDLVPLATGIDMLALSIQLAMGEEIYIEKPGRFFASLRHKICSAGRITNISGLKEAEASTGVKKIEVLKNIGDTVNILKSCDDRVAFVIAVGYTADEAICNAELACSKIKIELESESI